MRIAIYNPGWHVMGGGEKYLGTLAELLSEEHKVDLIITHPVDLDLLQRRLALNLQRVGVVELQTGRTSRPKDLHEWLKNRIEATRLQRALMRITRDYDLAVYLESDCPLRLAARRNILHIQVPHRRWQMRDFLEALRENRLVDFRRELVRSLTFRRSLDHFDLIIYNSRFTARVIEESWKLRVPSVVIYPPIDVPAESVPWIEKRNYILSVGRFFAGSHEKRHRALIEAFRIFCRNRSASISVTTDSRSRGDWELHLVGGTDDSPETVALIEQLKHASRDLPVRFHINADRSELAELYRLSKLFWHAAGLGVDELREPDRVEHFGMAVVEAMAYGCIPFAVNRGGLREIIEHGVNGFLWSTVEELVELTKSLTSNSTAEHISSKARARSQEFSREKFRQRIWTLLGDAH